MLFKSLRSLLLLLPLFIAGPGQAQVDFSGPARPVAEAERAFARSMAERNHSAFTSWLSEQALFFDGKAVLRGKAAVAAGWKPLFDAPQAPFSWEPDQIEVLDDGTLAHSSGPVRNAAGKLVGRFNSIWRQESPGTWRIVFDRGEAAGE
jgi:ketosteroid isomerase-like protein